MYLSTANVLKYNKKAEIIVLGEECIETFTIIACIIYELLHPIRFHSLIYSHGKAVSERTKKNVTLNFKLNFKTKL